MIVTSIVARIRVAPVPYTKNKTKHMNKVVAGPEEAIHDIIDGHVLIWAEGNMTYRLETNQSLEEAIKTAESLRAVP